jgi:azurin
MPILIDNVNGQLQGAVTLVNGEFQSGAHRAAVSPADGQMYVCGMGGWGTYAPKLGSFERIRYNPNGKNLTPIGFHVHENGIALRFNQNIRDVIDPGYVTAPEHHFAQAWDYRYSANYGSAEYSTIHTGVRGHDRMAIRSSQILDDGLTLFIEIPELQPCNQLHLSIGIGADQTCELIATCNALDSPRSDIANFQLAAKKIRRHPLENDLRMVDRKKANPWKNPLNGATVVEISAGQNLSFDQREMKVQAGQTVALRFKNPDVVPHNWALLKPGSLEEVGQLANRLIADPDAAFNQYIPQSDKVICYTDIVEGKESFEIFFRAPSEPGRYPYLCTFPGHWMVMNGVLVIEPATK